MKENQFCLSRNRYAIFTGNLIIHQIFLCSVVPDKAHIEEGATALLRPAISSSSFRETQRGYGKHITCMSKSNYHPGRETWAGWGGLLFFFFKSGMNF